MEREAWLRQVAIVGLCLAIVAALVAAMHHTECSATFASRDNDTTVQDEDGCRETYPGELMFAAFAVAFVGGVSSATSGILLAARERDPGSRVLVALPAALIMLSPALAVLAWSSIGFDLNMPTVHSDGRSYCTGPAGDPSFWLPSSTCIAPAGFVSAFAGVGAGAVGLLAAWRSLRSLAFASLVLAAIHLGAEVVGHDWFLTTDRMKLDLVLLGLMAFGAWTLPTSRPAR